MDWCLKAKHPAATNAGATTVSSGSVPEKESYITLTQVYYVCFPWSAHYSPEEWRQ
jgi:hypothetical protein